MTVEYARDKIKNAADYCMQQYWSVAIEKDEVNAYNEACGYNQAYILLFNLNNHLRGKHRKHFTPGCTECLNEIQ